MVAREYLVGAGTIAVLITIIALRETGTLGGWGTIGLIIAAFFTPMFVMRAWRMYERRDNLKMTYEMAKTQFAIIKANKKLKNKNRRKQQ